MTYAPFPEAELRHLADEYDETSSRFGEGSRLRDFYAAKATMLRNTITEHDALRTRFLEQSMRVRELEAKVAA